MGLVLLRIFTSQIAELLLQKQQTMHQQKIPELCSQLGDLASGEADQTESCVRSATHWQETGRRLGAMGKGSSGGTSLADFENESRD